MIKETSHIMPVLKRFHKETLDEDLNGEVFVCFVLESKKKISKNKKELLPIIEREFNDFTIEGMANDITKIIQFNHENELTLNPYEIVKEFENEHEYRETYVAPDIFIEEAIFAPNLHLLTHYMSLYKLENEIAYIVKYAYDLDGKTVYRLDTIEFSTSLRAFMEGSRLNHRLNFKDHY